MSGWTIKLPPGWKKDTPKDQEDSIVGSIISLNDTLSFDFSVMGYANHLLLSDIAYLTRGEWYHGELIFPGSNDINSFAVAKKDFSKPTKSQKGQFPKADYIAKLTYKNNSVLVPVEIPSELKIHNIKVDSTSSYYIKTIWPKKAGHGMTGVYFQSRTSSLNLQINGEDLTSQQQELALKAFKTIEIKAKGYGDPLPFR